MTPNAKLLGDLRAALINLKPSAGFNMAHFCKIKLPESPRLDCGSVCCAYGLGTTLPSWRAAGLKLRTTINFLYFLPNEDAKDILGLTWEQWNYLFAPTSYKTRKNKAREKIRPLDVVHHIIDVLNETWIDDDRFS